MNIVINTKLFEIFPNLVIAHIFNMLLFSQTNTYQQTYIAKHLGLTRMTVARSLKWLKTEGYIDYTRSKYKEVITTKFTLTEKALQIKAEIEKEENEQTEQQQEKKEEKKENIPTTHKEREQGDAPQGQIPNCSNEIKKNATKQPKPTNTKFLDIVAARREYENKLKEKFTIQNGKLS
ncbi:hypothetical protein HMPREF0653_00940 [Prevotella disiens JCM 6334 = ATCC 29426]|uniref:Uncharacterized protein n=2 Tax=Prevotella disiens TaxID=28130 RepID=A0A379E1I6_9BACT|nr:hypothetical protein HMPREF0653_00940 [Prevotella disiens JCM 6334 = ATCC 29426]SUB86142.1 Uncharacterised protein [Prevotella disiens]